MKKICNINLLNLFINLLTYKNLNLSLKII